MTSLSVAYIHSPSLQQLSDIGTHPPGRSSVVHELIRAYGLLSERDEEDGTEGRARVVLPMVATREDLLTYHTKEYTDLLLRGTSPVTSSKNQQSSDNEDSDDREEAQPAYQPRKRRKVEDEMVRHGLVDDCAPFPDLGAYALSIAGSSLTSARLLLPTSDPDDLEDSDSSETSTPSKPPPKEFDIVINFSGGRHHALRDSASGFCFVQDIVLLIGLLRKQGVPRPLRTSRSRRSRTFYLDLDIHFGDAVSAAFIHPYKYSSPLSPKQKSYPQPGVLTLSIHHQSPGFFPTDPLASLTPSDTTHPFTLSLPLHHAASAPTYVHIWRSCVEKVMQAYDPDYVVVVLGMDGLNKDPLVEGAGNWSLGGEGGVGWCVERLRSWVEGEEGRKLCILGGGGYDIPNTARAWALATSVLVGKPLPLDTDIPDIESHEQFSPTFTLDVQASHAQDQNDAAYLEKVDQTFEALWGRIREIAV